MADTYAETAAPSDQVVTDTAPPQPAVSELTSTPETGLATVEPMAQPVPTPDEADATPQCDPQSIDAVTASPESENAPHTIAPTDQSAAEVSQQDPLQSTQMDNNDLLDKPNGAANGTPFDDDANLLEATTFQPASERSPDSLTTTTKRKHGLLGDDRYRRSQKKFRDGQLGFEGGDDEDDLAGDDEDEDDDEGEEDDDDFDEDDDEEFELERRRLKAAADGFHKEYESDVDDSLGELSDDDERTMLKQQQRLNRNASAESLNLNDILAGATGGLSLDKTVQLADLVDNPEEMELEDGELEERRMRIMQRRSREDGGTEFGDDGDDEGGDGDDDADEDRDMDYELTQKLKDMGEVSLNPVAKSNNAQLKRDFDLGDEISLEITKRGGASSGDDTEDKRKITNLRKNIREVMDDNQLDASTLAAQRQELERLARVQEQQRLIRDAQRQIAMERQNSKTQNRVLSLLQGKSSMLTPSTSSLASLIGPNRSKLGDQGTTSMALKNDQKQATLLRTNLTPSVSIAPVRPPAVNVSMRDPLSADDDDSSIEPDEDSQPVPETKSVVKTVDIADVDEESAAKSKKDVVTIVDSSDDDCIMLSDDEEEPEDTDDPHNSGLHVNDAYNVPDDQGRIVVNIGHPETEEDIFVAPQIARTMKPHQIGGVRFLFDNIIESVDRFNSSTGFGCILAHSMGLGKTLQLVCFCDIFMRHTSSKTILCIMPINTLQNWMAEFNMWLPDESDKHTSKSAASGEEVRCRNFNLHVLNDTHKTLAARSKVVLEWAKNGGVLLMGYELYRLLSMKKVTKKRGRKVYRDPEVEKEEAEEHRKLLDEMHAALVKPGPDLCVCDEGHRIKNSHAGISIALKQMRSKRRIVLTGYPLQNNLLEYWCMVDFVRPNYLGTKTEFSNMFERPIQNGQCIDSTPQDCKLMRYRAHVLHSLLLGFVQRRSHVVLQNSLPAKEEFVLMVRMTEFQRKIYEVFMNEVVRTKAVPNPLKAFAVCCKIWNHPDVLYNFLKKREADLDLEEAEAAANDPSYEPDAGSAAGGTPVKGGKKKVASPKEKKSKAAKGKKAEIVVPELKIDPPVLAVSEAKPVVPEIVEVKKEEPTDTNLYQQPQQPQQLQQNQHQQQPHQHQQQQQQQQSHPQSHYNSYPPQENYNNYNNYDNYYNQYPNTYPNTNYSNYNQPGGYQSTHYPQQTPQQHQQPNNPQYPRDYWNPPSNPHNYYPNADYNQSYNQNPGYNASGYDYQSATYPQQPQHHQQHQASYPPTQPHFSGHPSESWPPNQSQSNQDIKPIVNESAAADIKPDTKFVDLDTKEIKIENPMSLNLEIAKIEDKAALKLELPKAAEETTSSTTTEPSTPDEKLVDPKEEPNAVALVDASKADATKTKGDDGIPYDWAVELMKNYVPDLISNSPKMQIFFCILEESLRLQDRLLVFSQSLLTLNLIEKFLQANRVNDTDVHWARNVNYYRLDGSTAAMEREKLINEFNVNLNVHLFLVSTRAGSLGINLVGANRVVVFDASWNPCHDTQAVCRVYRYGQQKPCFVYRLVMDNCLEKKIYDRQVNKQGMSDRVVDESNPDAHLSMKEVTNLCYDDGKEAELKDFSDMLDKYTDVAARKIITMFSHLMTKEPFQHETLLIDRKEKKLSMAEKRLAQRGYELEKQAALKPNYMAPGTTQYRTVRTPDGAIVHRPVASVRPMQADLGGDRLRTGITRATRWIPAEVWQRQGMTAQVLTLPGDVVIPTSSAEKSNIVLKEGQKVMVLKSPKGIYMQLETGKIIAIRTAFKMGGQPKEKQGPAALIGRDFTPKPRLTGTVASLATGTTIKPLTGPGSAIVPMSLKNNSAISITSNKTSGVGGRPVNMPPGHRGAATSGAIRPFGGAGAGNGSRPVSLLNNKPRPMMMQKGQALSNKPVQLGTARPYNLKQLPGGRMAPGPASSKITPPTYTMSSSSSNSNSSFDVDSMHNDDGGYFGKVDGADDDVTEVPTEILLDSDNEKPTGVEKTLVRQQDSLKEDVKGKHQDDDVIMVDNSAPFGSSPKVPASHTSSSSSSSGFYGSTSSFAGPPATDSLAPTPTQPFFGYDTTPQAIANPNAYPSSSYEPLPVVAQSHKTIPPVTPHGNKPIHSQIPTHQPPFPYQIPATETQSHMAAAQFNPYPPCHPVESASPNHTYPYSATGTIPPVKPPSILIDDELDQQLLREKVVYKPNLVARKSKASKKDTKPPPQPYPTPVPQEYRQQQSDAYPQHKVHPTAKDHPEAAAPQLHQPFLTKNSTPSRYPPHTANHHQPPFASQTYPQTYPPQQSANPSPVMHVNAKNSYNRTHKITPPVSGHTHQMSPDHFLHHDSTSSSSTSGHFNHHINNHSNPMHSQPSLALPPHHPPEPSSLSFLERTASSIHDNPSTFNMSLNDITKPPALDPAALHSSSSNSNSAPSPSTLIAPTLPPVTPVAAATKAKAKPRAKATPAPKKVATPKTPVEPKPPKEKPAPKSKKGAKNVPVIEPEPLPKHTQQPHPQLQAQPPTGGPPTNFHHSTPHQPHQHQQQSHTYQQQSQAPVAAATHSAPQLNPHTNHQQTGRSNAANQPPHPETTNQPHPAAHQNQSYGHPPQSAAAAPYYGHVQQQQQPTTNPYASAPAAGVNYPQHAPPSHAHNQHQSHQQQQQQQHPQQQQQQQHHQQPHDVYGSPHMGAGAPNQLGAAPPPSHQQAPYDAYNMGYPGYPAPPGVPAYQPPAQYEQMFHPALPPLQPPLDRHQQQSHQKPSDDLASTSAHDPPSSAAPVSHTSTPTATSDPHQSYATSPYAAQPPAHHHPGPYANHHATPAYVPPTASPYHGYPPPQPTSAYPPPAPPTQGYNYAQPTAYGGVPAAAFGRPLQQAGQPPQQHPVAPPVAGYHPPPPDMPYGGYPPYQGYPPYGPQPGQW